MGPHRSKSAAKAAMAVLAAGMFLAAPLHAQQRDDAAPIGQLIEGVRGFFSRIFGGDGQQPPAEPESPGVPAPQAAPAPTQAQEAAPPVVAPSPAAQAVSRNLHEAVVGGDYETTLRLLDQGADIEAKDPKSGASPLHYAVMKGRMQIVDLLLSRGADVNSRTRNGTTPLHTAALYARKEVAERLLEQHADINAVSAGGSTPLALATAAKNKPIAEMLRERGAK
jgi:hypothetical protein